MMRIILISSNVGKSPEDVIYSFVFDKAYRLG